MLSIAIRGRPLLKRATRAIQVTIIPVVSTRRRWHRATWLVTPVIQGVGNMRGASRIVLADVFGMVQGGNVIARVRKN
jgi:hypothetical protein